MEWFLATLRLNWLNMTAHKAGFWSMAFLMMVQNMIYFSLWAVFFNRVSSLNGWGLQEVAFIYASGALGLGLVFTVFGGINILSSLIHGGYLDGYLTRPRPILLSALMVRMRADSLGDIVTGIVMLAVIFRPSWDQLGMIVLLSVLAGVIFFSFRLIMQSLSFWGLSEETAEQGFMSFLIAATNPQKGFGTFGKFVLLTALPAGYVGLVPVEILRDFSWKLMLVQVLGVFAFLGFAICLFHYGLRRYASGNQFISLR